ncbi:hypothetical protein [Paenibacillus sp. NAIST15-1]|uniref:hypothetical protein n=1 Tax=Paenibacillus sp. NAIST15-1 TaxID=1605994 RepID=UPI00086B8C08|nr:hypothetical protein [Paenibacillus sp. NAIST15-1]GAV11394.1 hypothetical protein PBN151_1323 [Paenibacillus sp. NAIST15-1]
MIIIGKTICKFIAYTLIGVILYFSIFMPELSITLTGGFAWAAVLLSYGFGFILVYIGLFGGEFTYSSKGIKGWIKEMRKRNQK